ncbi:hypothetical protein HD806DRAFT_532101 [Xylariaceae sp. AK1471]|nr:hypothetical protein HD806DRAFT_532101 [Xylariaceae sp. AK1471]
MTTSWPQQTAWPTEVREHVPSRRAPLRRTSTRSTDTSQFSQVDDLGNAILSRENNEYARRPIHPRDPKHHSNQVKNETNITALTLYEIKDYMERTATKLQEEIQKGVKNGNEAKVAAREATEVGRTVTAIVREIKNNGTQNRIAPMPSYAAMASRGLATTMHNTQSFATTPEQIQREIIVNIIDPFTIAHLRAMNPRSLKAHIDRAMSTQRTSR